MFTLDFKRLKDTHTDNCMLASLRLTSRSRLQLCGSESEYLLVPLFRGQSVHTMKRSSTRGRPRPQRSDPWETCRVTTCSSCSGPEAPDSEKLLPLEKMTLHQNGPLKEHVGWVSTSRILHEICYHLAPTYFIPNYFPKVVGALGFP